MYQFPGSDDRWFLFVGSRPKKGLSSNGFTKILTVRLRSIVPKRPTVTAHGLLR